MSTIYPLVVVNAASIANLVRTTLYPYSISVYHTRIKTNEGRMASAGKTRDAAAKDLVTPLVATSTAYGA
jgi:hypothetical protein